MTNELDCIKQDDYSEIELSEDIYALTTQLTYLKAREKKKEYKRFENIIGLCFLLVVVTQELALLLVAGSLWENQTYFYTDDILYLILRYCLIFLIYAIVSKEQTDI